MECSPETERTHADTAHDGRLSKSDGRGEAKQEPQMQSSTLGKFNLCLGIGTDRLRGRCRLGGGGGTSGETPAPTSQSR